MKVLDVGCGRGNPELCAAHDVVGIDIDPERIAAARQNCPAASFLIMSAENMAGLADESFDWVYSNVAVPYMDIAAVLREVNRVLRPGGELTITLHSGSFAWQELRRAWPHPKRTAFRIFVLANGVWLHLTGRTLRLGRQRESFQTVRGISKALRKAGFIQLEFPQSARFIVTAVKPKGRR